MNLKIEGYIRSFRESTIAKRFVSGALWTFSGTAFAKLMGLLSGILCAHILGKSEYGELGMIRSTVGMFTILGTAGLGLMATKYISQYKSDDKLKVASIYTLTSKFAVLTGMIVTALILLLAPVIAENTLHASHLTNSIRVASVMLFISVINGAQNGTLYGFEDYKSIAINTFIGSLFESCLMLLGAKLYGVFGALLGFGSGYVVLYVLNKLSIGKCFSKYGIKLTKESLQKQDIKLLFSFSLPALLSSLLVAPTIWLIKTMLVRSDGFDELANFEAADYWKTLILYIPYAIGTIILPILSDSKTSSNASSYWRIIKYNILINGLVSLLISLFIIFFSPWLTRLFGSNYTDNVTLSILACSTIFTSVSNVIGLSITSRSLMWQGFLLNLIWALLTIGFSYYFINIGFGASGLALAVLLAYVIHTVNSFVYLKHSINHTK